MDEALDGAGMKSHTSMLGVIFVYTVALYADFQEKIFPEMSGKMFQIVPNFSL